MKTRYTAVVAASMLLSCGGGEHGLDSGSTDAGRDAGRDGGMDARVAPDAPMPPRCRHFCLWTCPEGACDDPVLSERMRARDEDADGLSDYDELCVHQSDPCSPDTGRDGCFDLAEHVLMEGCTDEDRGVFLEWGCGGSDVAGTLELLVPDEREEVRLLVVGRDGYEAVLGPESLEVTAHAARAADGNEGGATLAGDHFRDVRAGARLTFEVRLAVTMFWEGASPHVGTLRVVDAEGAVLAERLLVVVLPYCPVLI